MSTKIRLKITMPRKQDSSASISSTSDISDGDDYDDVAEGEEHLDDHIIDDDDEDYSATKKKKKGPKVLKKKRKLSDRSPPASTSSSSSFPQPPLGRAGAVIASQRGFAVPEQYKGLTDLTEQEVNLLEKYAKSKKVMLKVGVAKPLSHITSTAEKRTALPTMKRPQVMRYQTEEKDKPIPQPTKTGVDVYVSTESGSEFEEKRFIHNSPWHSRTSSEPLVLELPKLMFKDDGIGGNTVVIWGVMPKSSERFCINLSPFPHCNEKNPETVILYHFNPREEFKSHIIQNTFAKMAWGKPDGSISKMPITKEKQFELRIHILPSEFMVYLDGKPLSTFRNRAEPRYLKSNASLYLVVPVLESHYGVREDVHINRVWWGFKTPTPAKSLSTEGIVPGAAPPALQYQSNHHHNSHNKPNSRFHSSSTSQRHRPHVRPSAHRLEEKVLHVSGLSQDSNVAYNEMLRLFEPYGIEIDERTGSPRIHIIDGKGFGFITLKTSKSVDEAIQYLNGKPSQSGSTLSVSRARKKGGGRR